jgi:putative oxidoreductase
MNIVVRTVAAAHGRFVLILNHLQSALLLAVRLYWGFQFAQDGYGKLTHLSRVAQFFASLNMPAPAATALFVGLVEFVGGILFAVGLGTRVVSLVLFVNMTVAYLSVPDDRVNFSHILSNPSDFYNATPYTYWFAALLILIFGPGRMAFDTLLRGAFNLRQPE